ncbi:MAG: methionyl-tRNA formyltransferase [Candidatus Dormibacteria bacterium]
MASPSPSARPPASPYIARVEEWLWEKEEFRMVPDMRIPFSPDSPAPVSTSTDQPARVGFAGFPSDYSLAILLSLLRSGVSLAGIATSLGANPAIAGENALSQLADHLGVPLLRLARVNDYDSLVALERLRTDLFVVASFDQILGQRALQLPKRGWVNVHPSLLPRYRGPEPIYWAIVNGELESGVSFQRVAEKIDAGPLLAQVRVDVRSDDTTGTLTRRVSETGAQGIPGVIGKALDGDPGRPMELSAGSYYTSVGHRRIDGVESVITADRLVRAGNPNMLAATSCGGRLCYVVRARLVALGEAALGPRLSYPDGDLILEETVDHCGCHHGEPIGSCPHDE